MSFAAFGPLGRPPNCCGPIGKVQMEATGCRQADLAVLLGSLPPTSEVPSRKHALTVGTIHSSEAPGISG